MKENDKDLGQQAQTGAGTGATGYAQARSETEKVGNAGELERIDEGNDTTEETHDKARAAGAVTETVEGFSPFRAWCNREIRRRPGGVVLNYQNQDQAVTEITVDGQLRLEWGGAATLIPFDERYIPAILSQLLT